MRRPKIDVKASASAIAKEMQHLYKNAGLTASIKTKVDLIHYGLAMIGHTKCGKDTKNNKLELTMNRKVVTCPICAKLMEAS